MSDPADEVAVESLAAGGAGVAHLADGMIVFVPRTAPGDRVRLHNIKRRKRHAEAEIAEIVTAGPGRVEPPCDHFAHDRCGGCQWQHLSAETQAAAKVRIVGDALRRIGKLDVPDPVLVPSPRHSGYRATITLTVRRHGGHTIAGFHDAENPDRVFELERCGIARDEVNELWLALRPVLSALPHGDDVRLKLRVAPDGARHVVVSGGDRAWMGGPQLARALDAVERPATIWWHPTGGVARRVAGPVSDAAAVAFEQVNPEVAALLRDAVIAAATGQRVLDLYAGSGDTALPLAAAGREVVMVESEESAIRRAEERAAAGGVRLRCIAGHVEDQLAGLLPADTVVVNPPRIGLGERVTAVLREQPPARLVYVSCDSATLGRDLNRMGITVPQLRRVEAFDMFPQTSHVETLVIAEPGQAAPPA